MNFASTPIYIIAEAGVNHCGKLEIARELIRAASDTGADAIKFQTFRSELMSTAIAKKQSTKRLQVRNLFPISKC